MKPRFSRRTDRAGEAVQGEAQHIQHGIGGVGEGIDPPAVFLHGEKAQLVKPVQRRLRRKLLQGGADKVRLLPVVMRRGRAGVGQVAAAVAGGQELAADALLPLQQQHLVLGILRGGQRGENAGGAAADDKHSFHVITPILMIQTFVFPPRGVQRGRPL